MKKDIKKVLALSILSVGFLSSVSPAFCAPIDRGICHMMVVAQYLDSVEDLKRLSMVNKKCRMALIGLKRNAISTSLAKDIETLTPAIETFEDHHQINNDESIFNGINQFSDNNNNIKILIYRAGSFNLDRFLEILMVNDVDDFEGADSIFRQSLITLKKGTSTETKLVRPKDIQKILLSGRDNVLINNHTITFGKEKWIRVISTIDNSTYRVSFIEIPVDMVNLETLNIKNNSFRKIIFYFDPMRSMINNDATDCNIFESYKKFITDCGMEDFINTNFDPSSVKYIEVPKGSKVIGKNAFKEFAYLTSVDIPNSVEKICENAFYNCMFLKEINVPVKEKWDNVFIKRYQNFGRINIPNSIKEKRDNTFENYQHIDRIKIPEGVKEIGNNAFEGCQCINKIEIPDSVRTIGDSVFSNCINLEEIKISNNIKEIGKYAFYNCENLKEIDIPEGVDEIKDYTFDTCKNLEKVSIPDSIKKIGCYAFCSCQSLKEIKIPESIDHIAEGTFSGCSSLEEINIPENVKEIGIRAFLGCSSLRKIKIPDNINIIGYEAFEGCTSLKCIEYKNKFYKNLQEFFGDFHNKFNYFQD